MLLTCPQCGVRSDSPIFVGTGRLSLTGVQTNCPNGHIFTIPDGEYDMVQSVITAFRGATAAQIADLKTVAENASKRRISEDDAIDQAGSIRGQFAGLIALMQRLGGLPLLIALIALMLQIMTANSDDAADAAQLDELKTIARSNAEIAALLNETAGSPVRPRHEAQMKPSSHTKTNAQREANRRERRRMKGEARRKSSRKA